jgi:hypothetical protein
MSKTFDKEIDFYIGAVKVGGTCISVTEGEIDTQAAEDEFYSILRKHGKSIIEEAEGEEKSYIIDHLTSADEDKLGAEHMKDYHGDKDHWEDSYENFLEELSVSELKKILV